MFIEYLPRQTFIHSLDVRTKMIGFTGVVILVFLFNNPLYNLAMAVLVGMMAVSSGMDARKVSNILLPLLPIFFLMMLFAGFTPPSRFLLHMNQQTLCYLLPNRHLEVTVGGVLQGCTFVIRLLIMVVASSLVSLTTPIDDFIQLLNKLKLPGELSFAVTTALRFVPTMDKKRMSIIDAQKARGAGDEKGLTGHVRSSIPIMVPMIVNSIKMANNLALAMLNRGYGYSRQMTPLRQISFTRRDYAVCALAVLLTAVGVYLRFWLRLGVL